MKQNFSSEFIVNELPEWVNVNRDEILSKAIFNSPTIKYVDVMEGIKYKTALNYLDTDAVIQDRTCAFDASGNTTFTQREIEVAPLAVMKEFCPEDLRTKYMNNKLVTRAGSEELPFQERITNEVVDKLNKNIDKLIWTGDTSTGDKIDGWLKLISEDETVIAVDASAATSIYDKVKLVYMNIPVEVLDRSAIFVGVDDFRTYIQDLVTRNFYHYSDTLDTENLEVVLPGTNTKIIGVSGLNGTGAIIACDPTNLVYGCDVEGDSESYDFWYSKDNQIFRFVIKFNLGVNYYFGDQITAYIPAE